MKPIDYSIEIRPLSEEDGGGFLAIAPDLPGCMSDGETLEEAVHEVVDAIESWISVAKEFGDPIPVPDSGGTSGSGRFVPIIPKILYAKLSAKAKQKGVSLNSFVVAKLAAGI